MLLAQTDKHAKLLFAWGDSLVICNRQWKYSSLSVQEEWYEYQQSLQTDAKTSDNKSPRKSCVSQNDWVVFYLITKVF